MQVTSGALKIDVNPATGAVAMVTDAGSGRAHIDALGAGVSDARLFRVNVPGDTWSSRYADSHVQARMSVDRHDGGLRLSFPDLVAATGEPLGIRAQVDISPGDSPDEALFVLRLENRGSDEINEVRFPWFGGWQARGGSGRDVLALGARSFFNPHSLPTGAGNNYALNQQRATFSYPVDLFAPWVDLSGPGGGLSFCNYMPHAQNGCLYLENLAGYGPGLRLAFSWVHHTVIPPGESWTSPPMGLGVHRGDWRQTADRYRRWFKALQPLPSLRPSVGASIGFQNVFFRGFDGAPIRGLAEIPAVAATGRRYGVDHLCVWDARTLGNYINSGPGDLMDYPPEERTLLSHGLGQAAAEGTRSSALINFRHPHSREHLADPRVRGQLQRRYDGTLRTENWSGSHCHAGLWTKHLGPESNVFSPFSQAHQERVLRLTREYLDVGYSSIFYDQPFEYYPDYGRVGDGKRPEHTHREALALIARVRELLLANDPQALIIGEECDILATPWVDLWMSWRISQPSVAHEVAMTRYSIPHTTLSWVVDHEPQRAALAFAMGMHLCLMVHGGEATLADEPNFADLVGRLSCLRAVTADRTVYARFVDQLGLQVDGDEELVVHAYEGPQGPTVVAASPGKKAAGRVTVDRSAFSAIGDPEGGLVHGLDGATTPAEGDVREFSLEANEVAVWAL